MGPKMLTDLPKQAGRLVLSFPPKEGSNLAAQATQPGRQAATHLPLGEGGNLSQAGIQASQAFQVVNSQSGTHLPPLEKVAS